MASLKKRGQTYYIQHYIAGKQHRISLQTSLLQVAKEKVRLYESAQFRGEENFLPTKTPLSDIVNVFVEHIRTYKTGKSASTDILYLRQIFGIICPALKILNPRTGKEARKLAPPKDYDKRYKDRTIEAKHIEDITVADISQFISYKVRSRNLAPRVSVHSLKK